MRKGKFMEKPKANLSAVSNARYNSFHVHNSFLVFCTSIQLTFNRRDILDLREASCSKYNFSPDEIHLPPKGDPTSQIQSINFWRHRPYSLHHAQSWHPVHLCGMRKRGRIALAPIKDSSCSVPNYAETLEIGWETSKTPQILKSTHKC